MEILVCIKQVPDTTEIRIDPETNTLIRTGVPSIMNPFDAYAVEQALQLKEMTDGRVTVVTMGPPQAKSILGDALAMGVDDAYLVTDRKFGGSDTLATSYILASVARKLGPFDVILCGKQTTDGDTAQVGPALAEHLGLPHAAWVSRLERAEGGLIAYQELQSAIHAVFLPFPCLVTVEQDIYTPRLPSLKRKRETAGREVTVMGLDAFADQDEAHYGLNGSPTQVERIFPPPSAPPAERYEGETAAEALVERLRALKFL